MICPKTVIGMYPLSINIIQLSNMIYSTRHSIYVNMSFAYMLIYKCYISVDFALCIGYRKLPLLPITHSLQLGRCFCIQQTKQGVFLNGVILYVAGAHLCLGCGNL